MVLCALHLAGVPDLPNELWTQVIRYLMTIRSAETQSVAYQNKNKEKARQHENRRRQLALHCLSLTSRRLNDITTPILYASFHACATWHGIESLKLFYRTISDTTQSTRMKRLPEHIEYVENRLSDHLGNNLHDDTACPGAEHMAARFFYLLASVVKLASNLRYLCTVSVETRDISFWRHIIPQKPLGNGALLHGLSKLRSLSLQTHIEGNGNSDTVFDFYRTCFFLIHIPSLCELRTSGVGAAAAFNLPVPFTASFESLQRLELAQTMLELEEVLSLLLACRGLRHIVCEWAFLSTEGDAAPSIIYPGLLHHCESLQTLHIDMRNVRFFRSFTQISNLIGTFVPFCKLVCLTVCEVTLPGSDFLLLETPEHEPDDRIRPQLPDHLEKLVFLVEGIAETEDGSTVDKMAVLWHLLDDLKKHPSDLKGILVKGQCVPSAPNLCRAFAEIGVTIDVKTEFCQ